MVQTAYFCTVHLEERLDSSETLSTLEHTLNAKPYLEEDLFAFSNYECILISPYYWKKEEKKYHAYTFQVHAQLHAMGRSGIEGEIYAELKERVSVGIYKVTATDVPTSWSMIDKVPKAQQKKLWIVN